MSVVVPGRASILINNFDYGRFVGAAIDSALAQEWDDVEVVVVDDGSTDGSVDVIRSYGDRIVPVLQPNRGQAAAINAGYAVVTGEVVLLLDADDWFLPTKVPSVMRVLGRQDRLGWCFHPLAYEGGDGLAPNGPLGVEVDARPAMRRGRHHGAFAPATSGMSFTRRLAAELLPMAEDLRVPLRTGAQGTAADAFLKIAALGRAPGFASSERLAVQRLHGGNAYTGTRWADPRRAALELLIADELRRRWPELRPFALRKGLGGLQRLAAIEASSGAEAINEGIHAVAGRFVAQCTVGERARVRAHQVGWRLRTPVAPTLAVEAGAVHG